MKYSSIAEVTDLGPFVTKLILDPEQSMTGGSLDTDTFRVQVVRRSKKNGVVIQVLKAWGSDERYPSEGERKVVAAYVSDRDGSANPEGSHLTLELEVDPRISLGATIAFNGTFNEQVDCEYTVTQVKPILFGSCRIENLVFSEPGSIKTLLADEFTTGSFMDHGITLGYAEYQPKANGAKRPLLIWLHGAGEGGTDPMIAVSGNKVVNLVSEEVQQYFGGCYVLGPQAPTMWMDDGTGKYNTDGSSMYGEVLKSLIDLYIASHEDIDPDRIYLGGCSNGGFMTMKMIIAYPGMFAAAYPICEALADEFISDSDIEQMKKLPIWFTHATNDPLVAVNKHTGATFQRLIKAGAQNVHFSCFPSVTDRTGRYHNPDGTPYEYNGHFSWIPALNNECVLEYGSRTISLFEWLSNQKRK